MVRVERSEGRRWGGEQKIKCEILVIFSTQLEIKYEHNVLIKKEILLIEIISSKI